MATTKQVFPRWNARHAIANALSDMNVAPEYSLGTSAAVAGNLVVAGKHDAALDYLLGVQDALAFTDSRANATKLKRLAEFRARIKLLKDEEASPYAPTHMAMWATQLALHPDSRQITIAELREAWPSADIQFVLDVLRDEGGILYVCKRKPDAADFVVNYQCVGLRTGVEADAYHSGVHLA